MKTIEEELNELFGPYQAYVVQHNSEQISNTMIRWIYRCFIRCLLIIARIF